MTTLKTAARETIQIGRKIATCFAFLFFFRSVDKITARPVRIKFIIFQFFSVDKNPQKCNIISAPFTLQKIFGTARIKVAPVPKFSPVLGLPFQKGRARVKLVRVPLLSEPCQKFSVV